MSVGYAIVGTEADQTLLDLVQTNTSRRTRRAAKTKLTARNVYYGQGTPIATAGYATVTDITPDEGADSGATAVTITGTNLLGVTGVTFGGAAATSLVVVSATSLTMVTPAGTAGARNVVVTGTRNTVTVTGGFTYTA